MKSLFISCLIFTLSLDCFHPITATTASASKRWPRVNPVVRNIQSWCADTPNPGACFATIQTNPRNDLKSTREGAALILVDAAKANIRSTTAFITDKIDTVTDYDAVERLDNCLNAYNAIGSNLDFDPSSFDTPEGRRNATATLNRTDHEVTYDCRWFELGHTPAVVQQLTNKVRRFTDTVEAATIILSAIDA